MTITCSFALLASIAAPLAPMAGDPPSTHLFVLAGESNAVGFGADPDELPAHLREPRPDILFWFVEGPQGAISDPSLRIDSADSFVALAPQSDPSGATFGPSLEGFGAELTLGRVLAERLGEPVAILKFAFSGSSLALDWNPFDPGGLYAELVAEIAAAVAALEAGGHDVELGGFAWMQGESDALDPAHAWLYEWNLEELVRRLRVDVGAPELAFSIGRLNQFIDGDETGAFPYLYEVRDAQLFVDEHEAETVLIDTDRFALGLDGVHFSAAGQVELGEHFARAMLCEVERYCTAQSNSLGCVPAVGSIGVPDLSSSTPFWITASSVLSQQTGILFYGYQPHSAPFLGGTLCVLPPLRRTPPQSSGGTAAFDCSGTFAIDFKQRLLSGTDPGLAVGATVFAQYWYRDPLAPFGTGLTDGLAFVLCP